MSYKARQTGLSKPGLYAAMGELLTAPTLPTFPEAHWHQLIRFSGDALIAAQVCEWLASTGRLDELDDDIQAYLQEVKELNAARTDELIATFVRLAKVLNSADVCPIAMKGVAYFFADTPASELMKSRITFDIDALIPLTEMPAALQALKKHHYVQLSNPVDKVTGKNQSDALFKPIELDDFRNQPRFMRAHVPPFMDAKGISQIDLHASVIPSDAKQAEALTRLILEQSSLVSTPIDGAHYRIPSPEAHIVLCVYHAQIKNRHQFLGLVDWRLLFDLYAMLDMYPDANLVEKTLQMAQTLSMDGEMFTAWWLAEHYLNANTEVQRFDNARRRRMLINFQRRCGSPILSSCCQWLVRIKKACSLISPKELKESLGSHPKVSEVCAHLFYRIRRSLKG